MPGIESQEDERTLEEVFSKYPIPLAEHQIFRTTDPKIAREGVSRAILPHELRFEGDACHFDASIRNAQIRAVSITVLAYGADVELVAERSDASFIVAHSLVGRATFTIGTQSVAVRPGTAVVSTPGKPIRIRWPSGSVMMMIAVDRTALEAELETWIDTEPGVPLRFEPVVNVWDMPAAGWWSAVDNLVEDLDSSTPMLRHPAAASAAERGLIVGLLLAMPHNYSSKLWEKPPAIGPEWLIRATDLIERLPHRTWTAPELARAANTSTRALYDGFRRWLGTTPMEYQRQIRLRRAWIELRAADPDAETTTVTEVASRLGFTNLGRFAAGYRQRFGELPSMTLQRCREASPTDAAPPT
ncbi:AraC family transcriptional regulator [Promicromonospora sp. AC04]|uniref:AraC family transcriptional regulator n=1 Tax=Promicromonospora sp. AC04 TaxID=2135723 RepID=UPI000D383324|nr:AraC family transcriptional regulator [Promicromonospora sp. AC04]PUB31918.1 AraC family transcriptional regulator [Promicromonospora sp. AC04]